MEDSTQYQLDDLLRVMERLRDPQTGCPWDLKQDFKSIVPSTLEECYELAQAIEQEDHAHTAEELGDVLFQVIFYAQLGREQNLFSFQTVIDTLVRKLIRRHPHVFAEGDIEGVVDSQADVQTVKESWEAIKQAERAQKSQAGLLDDVPVALPALPRAQKLQKRAARVDFDWQAVSEVFDKVDEELAELRQALAGGQHDQLEEEVGDLLFSCVNLARHVQCDAEASLRRSSIKFEQRFRIMESLAEERGEALQDLDTGQLDQLWRESKARQRRPPKGL